MVEQVDRHQSQLGLPTDRPSPLNETARRAKELAAPFVVQPSPRARTQVAAALVLPGTSDPDGTSDEIPQSAR
jgi:hypothetical protein